MTICMGSFNNHNGNANEIHTNIKSRRLLEPLFNYSKMQLAKVFWKKISRKGNCLFKLIKRQLPSCAHVLYKTLNLVASRFCFATDVVHMYNVRAGLLFWSLHLILGPLFSHCRRRSFCLRPLIWRRLI